MAFGHPKALPCARPSNVWVSRRHSTCCMGRPLARCLKSRSNTFSSKAARRRSNILFYRNLLSATANQAAETPATAWRIDVEDCEEGDEEDEDLKLKILRVGWMPLNAGSPMLKVRKGRWRGYTIKKVIVFPVHSRDVTNQTIPGQELLNNSWPGIIK